MKHTLSEIRQDKSATFYILIMKKFRQYRGNQGRSPEKVNETFKLLNFVVLLTSITILAHYIYTLIQ
jgi:hypothetical protein